MRNEKYKEERRSKEEGSYVKKKDKRVFSYLLKSKEKQELLPVTAFYPSEALNLSTEM